MIKPLRRKHVVIWNWLALLLPLSIASAVMVRKPISTGHLPQPTSLRLLPFLVDETQVFGNIVQLRGKQQGLVQQLVWMNKEPLHVASATLYLAHGDTSSIASATYIGRIETRGEYAFDLPAGNKPYWFLMYDFIHQQKIAAIRFD